MRTIIYRVTTLLVSATGPLLAQEALFVPQRRMSEEVRRTVDAFNGDTLWETKYGRLDEAHGCARSNLAIVWKLRRGSRGQTEWLTYEYDDLGDPFHRARWINAVGAAVNVDGQVIETTMHPLSPKLEDHERKDRTVFSRSIGVTEMAVFRLPDSTLRLVAAAAVAKIRVTGTERTCDGTVEQKMKDRLRALLAAAGASP